ncbi:methylase involved in ubiquinone/menaquinone biosynthesis-like protein [Desulforamulus reducens MI-1]|uniref:Methylase involved in ubiquinone/menaquinone biosynthesis-like protein n=1 Tax=Desulforamulus reducens (strain ATCC BAA-1160 / DSM 100696 / MI-1) TaxID=349161 RepID=A4J4C3_DESRM|nr:ubiquinone/menaquinone biosynthesis methyltransferase [Desulforamulus reducens]ABO49926.1 methylase involved in ubiquinone/menaquinone biosynthesis-like protein [Desulforamulus reducens MI-1]
MKGKETFEKLCNNGLIQENKPLKLHLGCGEQHFEGYINIDYPPVEHNLMNVAADVYADINQLDFPAGVIDEVRLHHVFEHFNRVTALALLIRWHSWLKIGGKLIIETPDLMGSARTILSDASFQEKMAVVRHLTGDQAARWAYHVDQWFQERFEKTLEKLGFQVLQTYQMSWSREPYLSNILVVAQKIQDLPLDEQFKKASDLLWYSTVDSTEIAMHQVWRDQLAALLFPVEKTAQDKPVGE